MEQIGGFQLVSVPEQNLEKCDVSRMQEDIEQQAAELTFITLNH